MYPVDTITLPNVKEDDLDDVPPLAKKMAKPQGDHRKVLQHNQWRQAVQGYLASVTFVDSCVGRVIDALDASAYRDNTIIVLWSDHGWHLGEKLHWRKFALWEEATHNVMMMIAPDVTQPNQRCTRPVTLLDIYPTLIELCDIEKKPELEGRSLVPLLKDPNTAWDRPALTTHGRDNHSLRTERWRYTRYSDGTEELYDHDTDPLEWKNLADAPRYANVKQQMAAWLPRTNVPEIERRSQQPDASSDMTTLG